MTTRLISFDSLRFLAALVVVLSHTVPVFPTPLVVSVSNWGIFNAKSAVAFFFVLSGLVLQLSWSETVPTFETVGKFLARRWLRIYPLYYVSLVLCALALCLPLKSIHALLDYEVTSRMLIHDHSDLAQWLHHLMLVSPGLDSDFLNPPIWTLAAEMRVAFIFPFIAFVTHRLSMRWGAVLLVGAFLSAPALSAVTIPTVSVVPLFMLGAWAGKHRKAFAEFPTVSWWAILPATIIGYAACPSFGKAMALPNSVSLYPVAICSGFLLVAVDQLVPVKRTLETLIPKSLANVSYGIYVLHFPIILGMVWIYSCVNLPAWSFPLICIFTSVGVSILFNRLVEVPMIDFGRRLGRVGNRN